MRGVGAHAGQDSDVFLISKFLLDRIDAIAVFSPPTREGFGDVLRLHLRKVIEELSVRLRLPIGIEDAQVTQFAEQILRLYFGKGASNRTVVRVIGSTLRNSIADAKLSGKLREGEKVKLRFAPENVENAFLVEQECLGRLE